MTIKIIKILYLSHLKTKSDIRMANKICVMEFMRKENSDLEDDQHLNLFNNHLRNIKYSKESIKTTNEIPIVSFHGDGSFITFGRLTADENEYYDDEEIKYGD